MNIAETLWTNDPASQLLGIKIVELAEGNCRLSMQVLGNMTNGYDVCHGGFIYTFADTASAFVGAINGQTVLSAAGQIEYLAPAMLNSKLTAIAKVNCTNGRNIYCDVEVVDDKSSMIAIYRGKLVIKKN